MSLKLELVEVGFRGNLKYQLRNTPRVSMSEPGYRVPISFTLLDREDAERIMQAVNEYDQLRVALDEIAVLSYPKDGTPPHRNFRLVNEIARSRSPAATDDHQRKVDECVLIDELVEAGFSQVEAMLREIKDRGFVIVKGKAPC